MKQRKGRGVLVTTQSESNEFDFISRYFAPWVGVNEDPVTGSAHCALTVYWSEKLGKLDFKGYQASERGGHVATELLSNGRTKLTGAAVTVIKGVMQVFSRITANQNMCRIVGTYLNVRQTQATT